MITDKDKRVNTSKFIDEFKDVAQNALNYIRKNYMKYAKKGGLGYTYEFSAYNMMKVFDSIISKHGFEIDARTLRHAHGIGNNKEWDVVDKNIEKVGSFMAVDNMYSGAILSVYIRGERLDGFELCSGGFIREFNNR